MIDPVVFIGEPVSFLGLCYIYPPTIKEVLTNEKYGVFTRVLTLSQEEIQNNANKNGEQINLTPLEFLLSCAYNDQSFKLLVEQSFYFYTREEIVFSFETKQIFFNDFSTERRPKKLRVLDETNFLNFQNEIRKANGLKPLKPPIPIDPDEDPRIRRIKELARKRDAIKAKQKNKDGLQLSTCLTAICCMGIGITPLNIGEMSYAAIEPIMTMMQEKEKYDIDIRSLLAGASSKKVKPKYWIRNND